MTAAAIFAAARTTLFGSLGEDGWLTRRANTRAQIKAIIIVPDPDDLDGKAPLSLDSRIIDLPSTASAATGDLVTVGGVTYGLSGVGNPDPAGTSRRWIGVPLGEVPPLVFSYHVDGYPLVSWIGVAWMASP